MDRTSIGMLIAAFVVMILGASLVGVTAEEEQKLVTKTWVSGEQRDISEARVNETTVNGTPLSVTYPPTGWKEDATEQDCWLSDFAMRNQSNDTLTLNTHYKVSLRSGNYTLIMQTKVGDFGTESENLTYVDYRYCPDDYLPADWQRSILNLVPGFFGFILLAVGIGLMFGIMRREGILGI
jgi:hypothetical protein